ncbi:MAG TPA: FliM/FliN family flagellar motor switch protein, partial [Rhodocyclaceae bacterium]|nr:FliM/FliN family flagellar motor switch protein [Rhodocyclaceae bacterium]
TPSEIVVAVTFSVELLGNSADMHLCLPYSMVEPIRDVLYSTMHSEQAGTDRRWTVTLGQELQEAQIELQVALAKTKLTLGEVVNLKVGDVIPISIEDTVLAMVSGVPVMECRYGIRNGQYALKIERFAAQDEAQHA